MGWKLHDLDPRLQQRIAESLQDAEAVRLALKADREQSICDGGGSHVTCAGSPKACRKTSATHSSLDPQTKPIAQLEVGKDGIQAEIRKWCDEQWPRWKVIQARSDKRSTIEVGCHDMTIFGPFGKVWCIEVKAKNKKIRKEQLAWHLLLEMLGHKVHVVHSLQEFLEVIEPTKYKL